MAKSPANPESASTARPPRRAHLLKLAVAAFDAALALLMMGLLFPRPLTIIAGMAGGGGLMVASVALYAWAVLRDLAAHEVM